LFGFFLFGCLVLGVEVGVFGFGTQVVVVPWGLGLFVVVAHRALFCFGPAGDVADMFCGDDAVALEVAGVVGVAVDGGLVGDDVQDECGVDPGDHHVCGPGPDTRGAGVFGVFGALAREFASHDGGEQGVGHAFGFAAWVGCAHGHGKFFKSLHDQAVGVGGSDGVEG
jgi:hypothetical protein